MSITIHAVAAGGRPVAIPSSDVLALSPDQHDAGRTRLFLENDVVSADGCYEDWMASFARDWNSR